MLNRFLIIVVLNLAVFSSILSQKEANIWYFGNRAGFDFNNGDPIPLDNGALETRGISAVASHPITGELLFYTDATNVWDLEHQIMPNGSGLNGGGTTQSALIVPLPSSDQKFYLFTLYRDATLSYSDLYYHIIDMQLNDGLGDVVETRKNQLLLTNLTGKLTAVPHTNEQGFWLITHEYGTDFFYTFLISANGLSSFNTQAIGPRHYPEDDDSDVQDFFDFGRGYLKPSPDSKKLASTISIKSFDQALSLFDFDAESGVISNYRPLDVIDSTPFGLSFSPGNTMLYVSTSLLLEGVNYVLEPIIQYDLRGASLEEINNSRIGLISNNPFDNINPNISTGGPTFFGLQLAPDGRIYNGDNWIAPLSRLQNHDLIVIDQPDKKGFEASPQLTRFDFNSAEAGPLLPNFLESTFDGLSPRDNPNVPCEVVGNFNIFPNPSTRFIQIEIEEECFSPYRFELYNAKGILINQATVSDAMSDLVDMGQLSIGLYVIILRPLASAESSRFPSKIIRKIIKS